MRRRTNRTLFFFMGRPLWQRRRHRPRRPRGRYPKDSRPTIGLVGAGALVVLIVGLATLSGGSSDEDQGAARAAAPVRDDDARPDETERESSVRRARQPEAPANTEDGDAGIIRFRLETRRSEGTVYCGLFKKDSWPGLPIAHDIVAVDSDEVVCEFEGVEPGEYGAGAFHDENGNDNLDLNWIGMPTEGLTFTGGVQRLIPLPGFDDIKFSFDGDEATVEGELG
jgi:uncharacterized protein (DUF2141 family)